MDLHPRRAGDQVRGGCLLFAFLLTAAATTALGREGLEPLRPMKVEEPPIIDGILEEEMWSRAPKETGFKTYSPDYEIPMVENTVVYYAYDRENLYFAFRCYDSRPDTIKASVNARDKIRPDDWICVNLDSFNDQQSVYALYCNPLGIQADSRFEGGDEDFTVDVVWYSAGRIDETGYTIEMKLPFKSIRLAHTDPVVMGVIFERKISRRSEAGTYPPLSPVHGPNFLTQTRPIVFYDIQRYTLLEILPALTYSRNSELDLGKLGSPDSAGDISLTAKYGLTSRLILDGTLNPDFSQVESDAGQVDFNLRYSLFYPEKRPFFLEGQEKFNFGGADASDPLGEVVHTRTIVNPVLGFKLNGNIGDRDMIASIYALDELPAAESGDDYAHFGIVRYKRALGGDGFIGGFYTGRERSRGYNRVLGTDGQFRINPSSLFAYHAFLSRTKPRAGARADDGHAIGLHYFYNTRDWVAMLGFQDISSDFNTESGYVTRTGLSRLRSGLMRMFYPKSGSIRRIDALIHSFHIRDRSSRLYETFNALDVRFLLGRSTVFQLGGRLATEVFLEERFNRSGTLFKAQSQITKQFTLSAAFSSGRKLRYTAQPYQGRGNDMSLDLEYLASEKLHFNLGLVYSDFTRSSNGLKEYDYTILRSRNVYQVNRYLFFRGILEYNSFRRQLLTDLLASFTYIPGTVIHIGYGSFFERLGWEDDRLVEADAWLETRRGFFFKASWLWRM